MKNFFSVHDVDDLTSWITSIKKIKENKIANTSLGKGKTIVLIFLNPSLRTRLSTQKAAFNLGMNVMVINGSSDSWQWELNDNVLMNGSTVEHIKDAAAVISLYADVVGIRCFPSLINKQEDYSEKFFNQFVKYCTVPVISLESATRHPLQSLADTITIFENWTKLTPPKVVLTWAPHIKPLPQAVPNSFAEWMCKANVEFIIAQPKGFELCEEFTNGAIIINNQDEALKNADFVYAKNWSSYTDYGKMANPEYNSWLLNEAKMQLTNNAKIMHCLPVRRNVELPDSLIDCPNSLILQQAANREYAAQAVIQKILETPF